MFKRLLVALLPFFILSCSHLSGRCCSGKGPNGGNSSEVKIVNERDAYREGELLVKFKSGVSEERIEEILSRKGCSIIKRIKSIDVFLIRLPEGMDVREAEAQFRSLDDVEYAEPNYIRRIFEGE